MNHLVKHANRRAFLAVCAGIGVTSNFFAGALCALAAQDPTSQIDDTMIDQAAFLAGVSITPGQKKDMLVKLNQQLRGIKAVRKLNLTNDVPPAYRFDPLLTTRIRLRTRTGPDGESHYPGAEYRRFRDSQRSRAARLFERARARGASETTKDQGGRSDTNVFSATEAL